MKREEAIMRLKQNRAAAAFYAKVSNRTKTIESELLDVEAFTMAIEALKDRPHGEWIDKGTYAECSICGADSGTQFDGVQPVPRITSFCPDCGADMRGETE